MDTRRHPLIITLGFSEAAMFLRSADAPSVAALISIHGVHESSLEAEVRHRLDLSFDDVDAPDPSDPFAVYHSVMRRREEAENGRPRRPPTVEDAEAIICFAAAIQHVSGVVLCHCGGGISRSPAAALLCLAAWTGPGREQECVDHVLTNRTCAFPHAGLVRFGDQLLGRGGRLLRALPSQAWDDGFGK